MRKTVITRDWDAARIKKVRKFLKDAPELDVPYVWAPYSEISELYTALHLNHGLVKRLGLNDSITYLVGRMHSHSQGPVPDQTIRDVILFAALRSEGLAVALMKLDVDPNVALDIYLEHRSFNPRIYPLVAQGIPFEWAVKISDERVIPDGH